MTHIFPAEGTAACQPGSSRAEIGRKRRWGSGKLSSIFWRFPVASPSPPPLLPLIRSHTDLNGLFVPPPLGGRSRGGGKKGGGRVELTGWRCESIFLLTDPTKQQSSSKKKDMNSEWGSRSQNEGLGHEEPESEAGRGIKL